MSDDYQSHAAAYALRLIDELGTHSGDLGLSFVHASTTGLFPKESLDRALSMLLRVGFVVIDVDTAMLTPRGAAALALEGEALAHVIAREVDASTRAETNVQLGESGEVAVEKACRHQLEQIGRTDLASRVIRASLVSDALGYDIVAPRADGVDRLIEVKTTSSTTKGIFPFYISRFEYDVGRRSDQWSLVACETYGDKVEVIGWTRSAPLAPYLPDDRSGRWTEAQVRMPQSLLFSGLPPVI